MKGLTYTLLSLLLAWRGIPFGIICTIWNVAVNCGGGTGVTNDVLAAMSAPPSHDRY